ncbi:MAG: MBL fold metallo-hydrolase [Sedimentisphaerales bacterium]|nr:MBL fold metallo-hydrolase [Sedimentisphaerales bacterium]
MKSKKTHPNYRVTILHLALITFLQINLIAGETEDSTRLIYKGPYTITVLTDRVYHIEDANESNPAGIHAGGMNNCSDMYLIVGQNKAMLIDLSNAIRWDSKAAESLRSIVYERTVDRELYITITHNHSDHLGMLPAFIDDTKANFWLSEMEFKNIANRFPKERTVNFSENTSFDLGGGFVINTIEVPGHTAHSTLFFLKDKNLVFSGDAIGSGSGIWLFNNDSFFAYIKGIENLIKYIEAPSNNIDTKKLVIHGGHAWQKGELEKLTSQYIYDMKTLIEKIGQGNAETTRSTSSMSFLDTNFKYGTATITWNREAADKYAESLRSK